MLHFNAASATEMDGGAATISAPLETLAWKVLVMDGTAQRILSPIMKVNDLRDNGVTLYLQLHGERQPIAEVPAVYFVEPTEENITRICRDLQVTLYDAFYLNFTSSIPRNLLEVLANEAVRSGTSGLLAKENLFSLGMPNVHVTLNDAASPESSIDSTLEQISAALFSVLLTFALQPPLLYSSKGTAAEIVAEKLDSKIRNHLLNTKSTHLGLATSDLPPEGALQRPLLVLLDRNFDISTLLKHTSTYNALVHDVLKMHLNRVTIVRSQQDGGLASESKVYDIDIKDNLWRQNASLPFPSVAENVDAALNAYKTDMQQITRTSGVKDLKQVEQDLNSAGSPMSAEELKVAINVLPELTERKRIIDSHLQMSTALLEQIKGRNLGEIFHLEQEIGEQTKGRIIEIIRSKGATPADKMRLFLVYYFAQEEIPKEDMLLYEGALKEAGCEMAALEYCKKTRHLMRISSRTLQSTSASTPRTGSTSDFFQSFGTKLSSGVLGSMLSSVKNLLPESADTPLTKLVGNAIELAMGTSGSAASTIRSTFAGGSTPREDHFAVHDPKIPRNVDRRMPTTTQRSAFNHLLIFIVGGSNYAEYNHVEEFIKKRQYKMQVTFGATELLTGEEFLSQLARLYRP